MSRPVSSAPGRASTRRTGPASPRACSQISSSTWATSSGRSAARVRSSSAGTSTSEPATGTSATLPRMRCTSHLPKGVKVTVPPYSSVLPYSLTIDSMPDCSTTPNVAS